MAIYGEVQNMTAVRNEAVRFGYYLSWDADGNDGVWYWIFVDRVLVDRTQAISAAIVLERSEMYDIVVVAATAVETEEAILATIPRPALNRLILDWEAVVDAASYQVYGDAGAGGDIDTLLDEVTVSSYTTAKLESGTYQFKVQPVDAAGNETASAVSAAVVVRVAPRPPRNFIVQGFDADTGKVTTIWEVD